MFRSTCSTPPAAGRPLDAYPSLMVDSMLAVSLSSSLSSLSSLLRRTSRRLRCRPHRRYPRRTSRAGKMKNAIAAREAAAKEWAPPRFEVLVGCSRSHAHHEVFRVGRGQSILSCGELCFECRAVAPPPAPPPPPNGPSVTSSRTRRTPRHLLSLTVTSCDALRPVQVPHDRALRRPSQPAPPTDGCHSHRPNSSSCLSNEKRAQVLASVQHAA